MCKEVIVYTKSQLSDIPWLQYENGEFLKRYFEQFAQKTTDYMRNVETKIGFVAIGQKLIPFTVNEAEYDNSYVCAPFTHYILYAREELRFIPSRFLRKGLAVLLNGIAFVAKKMDMNRIVYVNNFCLSTNLTMEWSAEEIRLLKSALMEKYPSYQIGVRSINELCHPKMMRYFNEEEFILLPSRYVYISTYESLKAPTASQKRTLKRDAKCIAPEMEVVDHEQFTDADVGRIVELYNQLYIEKYSELNPQFTEGFIRQALQHHLFHFRGIKIGGQLEAISGSFVIGNMMTNPVYGYNLVLFPQYSLYRALRHLDVSFALEHQYMYHQSAGAGQFKKVRGGVGTPEYTALYVNHLPFVKKTFWKMLSWLLRKVGIPLIERFEL